MAVCTCYACGFMWKSYKPNPSKCARCRNPKWKKEDREGLERMERFIKSDYLVKSEKKRSNKKGTK